MRKIVLFPLFALLILLMPSLSSAEYGWNVRSDDFMIDEYDWNDNDTQSYDYDYDYEYDTTSRYGIEPLESNYRSNIRNRYIDRSYENSYIKPTQYERASYRGSLYDYSTSSYYDVKGTAESTGGGYLRNKGSYYDYDSSKFVDFDIKQSTYSNSWSGEIYDYENGYQYIDSYSTPYSSNSSSFSSRLRWIFN